MIIYLSTWTEESPITPVFIFFLELGQSLSSFFFFFVFSSHQQDVRAIGPAREPAEVVDERRPRNRDGARQLESRVVAQEVPFAFDTSFFHRGPGKYSICWMLQRTSTVGG